MARLTGRKILITGGASGIGLATAKLFRQEGARLALLDNDGAALEREARGLDALAAQCDISSSAAVEAAVARAAGHMGGIDGVVNCAAITQPLPFAQLSVEQWQRVISINLGGTFLVCKHALPWLSQNERATIVNVASAQALLPSAGAGVDYAASKGGVVLFSKSLAAELAPKVRVNVVCPGVTNTPMVQGVLTQSPDIIEGLYATNLIKRLAAPEEPAYGILFLTSDESSFVTGSVLAVDGGRSRH